jgi:cytochrome c biogenesis protein ResB
LELYSRRNLSDARLAFEAKTKRGFGILKAKNRRLPKKSAVFSKQRFKTQTAKQKISMRLTKTEIKIIQKSSAKNLFVFGESGKWNRLGAYIVHVFLLTLFLGHFVALQTGFDADVRMMPGQVTERNSAYRNQSRQAGALRRRFAVYDYLHRHRAKID